MADIGDRVVGAHIGASFGVAPEHRGRGIGSALVALHLLQGDLCVWHLDTPAYSPGGAASHLRGRDMAVDTADRLLTQMETSPEEYMVPD